MKKLGVFIKSLEDKTFYGKIIEVEDHDMDEIYNNVEQLIAEEGEDMLTELLKEIPADFSFVDKYDALKGLKMDYLIYSEQETVTMVANP